jgi:pimeloyl-ACP methyl ester carboxylesterase
MADARVEAATRNLVYRFVGQGVDYNDFVRTTSRIERWADWLDAWVETGGLHEARAQAAEANGRMHTAGDAYLRAALCFHFGKSVWLEDLDKYRATADRSVASHRRGMCILDPSFERLEIPFDRDKVVANLRRPDSSARPPVVILVPGLDSSKEEFTIWEESFLNRGLATVSVDGPGQGEGGYVNGIRPDYETPVGALLDVLAARGDLDLGRIGISGLGMGGYYAARTAAFEPRIRAVGVVGGAYQFPRMPPAVRAKFTYDAHLGTEEEVRHFAEQFTLDGVASRITQPYLVIHGQHDAVMTPEEAEQAARQAPRGEFRLYEDGNTVCHTVGHLLRPFLADWIKDKLGG